MATLEVGSGKTYATIQLGVNDATEDDTVLVYPGTYAESVDLTGKHGGVTTPIIIKALNPARKTLDGIAGASAANQSIIDASGHDFGMGHLFGGGNESSNILIDGFKVIDATKHGFFFNSTTLIWIRNCWILDCSSGGEDNASFGFDSSTTNTLLLQNNLVEAFNGDMSNASMLDMDANIATVEFNEFHQNAGSGVGRTLYIHGDSDDFIFRYNYLRVDTENNTQTIRLRDAIRQAFHNNFLIFAVAQPAWIHQEDTDNSLTENTNINNNTFIYEAGGVAEVITGVRFQTGTSYHNNILANTGASSDLYAFGRAFTSGANDDLALTNNDIFGWNGDDNFDPVNMTNVTESGSIATDPQVNTSTGLAAGVANATYGSNLNISSIPYKDSTGANYSWAFMFSMPYTVPNTTLLPFLK